MWERDNMWTRNNPDRNNHTRRYILAVGIFLVLGLVLAGAIKFTSYSGFCKTCHEMEPSYNAWRTSNHKSVECVNCHADPGIIGLIKTKAQGLSEVYRHITGNYKTPITITSDTNAFSSRCLICHKNIKGKGKPHNKTHFEVGANCTGCHHGLVHDPDTNRRLPNRSVCVPCHGEEITG